MVPYITSCSEKRSFLVNDEVWVDDGEECFICKEALVNQSAPCIGDPPPESDDKPRPYYPLRLWPCDHIVGDQCFKAWMSNSVNSEAGLCPFCRQPLLIAPEPQSILKKVKQYFLSSRQSSVPDQLVHDLRELHCNWLRSHSTLLKSVSWLVLWRRYI